MLIFPVSLTVMIMAPLGGRVSDRVGSQDPCDGGSYRDLSDHLLFQLHEVGVSD